MNRITPKDIRKGVETVSASPESTWYKVVETLDNGDELCLAIGMGEGFDEDTICAKLGVLAYNSAMSDYVWDFVMPWNLGEGGNDVWDTEVSNPNESDAEWFNKIAQEMIRGFEDGTIGTSLLGSSCGKKKGKKKPVKSSMSVEELPREALWELKQRYYAEKYDEELSYGELADIDDIVSDEEVFDEYGGTSFTEDDFFCLANSRKPVKSGLYDEAKAFDPKDYDFNKVYDFIYKKYSERIERELDNLLYNIQKELGITTGDTLLDFEDCVNKLVEILTDQYGNRS